MCSVGEEFFLEAIGPPDRRRHIIERSVLQTIAGAQQSRAPRRIAAGQPVGALPYLLLGAVEGATAERIWNDLPRSTLLPLAGETGRITVAIQRRPRAELAKLVVNGFI